MALPKKTLKRAALIMAILIGIGGAQVIGRRVFAGDSVADGSNPGGLYYAGTNMGGSQFNPGYAGPMPGSSAFPTAGTDPNTPASGAAYKIGKAPRTKYGIMYEIWHCPAIGAAANTFPNLPNPVAWFWHGTPAPGYYCNDAGVMATHAAQLRDAGIDFVMVDFTNWTDTSDAMTQLSVMTPFVTMLQAFNTVKGAPKVVPLVPIQAGATLPYWIDAQMRTDANKGLFFGWQGKPLLLSWQNAARTPDPTLVNNFSNTYTVRTMTGLPESPAAWFMMSPCTSGFKASGGTARCGQAVGHDGAGNFEQVSVTTAYQFSFMTADDAVPKFGGKTFHQQMARMDEPDVADPPIVTLESWNEWIAMRWCYKGGVQVTCDTPGSQVNLPNGKPVAVDMYDAEYNRDIEPGSGYGDAYYKQMIQEVLVTRKQAKTAVIGFVDKATKLADGSGAVHGWACSTGYPNSITVEVYANGPAGVGEIVGTGLAKNESEEDVSFMCQDGFQGAHRFVIPISAASMARVASQTVYVRGLSPVGKDNFMIANSGTMDFTGAVTSMQSGQPATPQGLVSVFRFRSPDGRRHFYSANYGEGVGAGMISEGVAFYLKDPSLAGPNMRLVYRCSNGNGFLSTDPSCENARTEGPLGWAYAAPTGKAVAVSRFVNGSSGDNLFTLSAVERATLPGLGYQPKASASGEIYVDPTL